MRLRAVRGIVLTAAVLALAGPARSEIRSPSTVVPTPGWSRFALPNGTVILTAERPGVPIVVVRVSVEAGASLDPHDKAGVANLTALLLTRGSASDEELGRARSYLVGSFAQRMATATDVSDLLISIERFDLGPDYPARFSRAVSSVTADDVLRAVRTHWDPDGMSLVVVGNLREAGIGAP
jgi:predicted Zn-dependent peptidase